MILEAIYFGLKSLVGLVLTANLIYQMVETRKITFSKDMSYAFRCTECHQKYSLDGEAYRKNVTGFKMRKEITTFRRHVEQVRFTCPKCGRKAFQEKIPLVDLVGPMGYAQVYGDSPEPGKNFLIKGFLPLLLHLMTGSLVTVGIIIIIVLYFKVYRQPKSD